MAQSTITEVSLDEAATQLVQLFEAALNGAEVVIARNGQSVKLTPVAAKPPRRQAGSAKGIVIYMADDFDATPEEFKEYL